MKLLSIAVPCYNSEAYMENCIRSLLVGGDEVEILIVDDGSTDGTAEIADRLGVNIELVMVNSLGRAAALASGAVDAVFWTRTSSNALEGAAVTEAEREAKKAENDAGLTEEEVKLMDEVNKSINFMAYGTADMPEGTIVTEPYFSDVLVPVFLVR